MPHACASGLSRMPAEQATQSNTVSSATESAEDKLMRQHGDGFLRATTEIRSDGLGIPNRRIHIGNLRSAKKVARSASSTGSRTS